MSASPAVMGSETARRSGVPGHTGRDERLEIPAEWRIGQLVVIGIIFLVAIYYFTAGWRIPRPETGSTGSRTVFDAVGFLILAGITCLTTRTARVIAMTTFQEALRRRW